MPTLSRRERDEFEAEGYLIVDPGVAESTLDGILADVDSGYPRREIGGESRAVGRVQDAWKSSDHVRALATAPRVLEILRELYGRKPLPFQTLNFPIGTQQRPHSDTIHFDSIPGGLMCGVWAALEDIDLENGPLIYYPGTHKLPVVSMDDVDEAGYLAPSFYDRVNAVAGQVWHLARQVKQLKVPRPIGRPVDAYVQYENYIGDLIARVGPEPRYGTLKKGQALIWASNLLHGGSPQADMGRTRHSQVTHYYFEECKYYTPRLSKGRNLYYREPAWIA